MIYPFSVFQSAVEGHIFWVAKSNYLRGCVGQGDSQEEAIEELKENEKSWLETAKKAGIPIPQVTVIRMEDYSGKMTLRMSPSVHREAAMYAKYEGISLNQYVNNALITYNEKMAITS